MRRYRALVIPMSDVQPVRVVALRTGDLDAMQAIVNGLIEPIDIIGPEATLWVNEEYRYLGFDVNRRATGVAILHGGLALGDYILGDAFLTGETAIDGYSTDVPALYLEHVARFV